MLDEKLNKLKEEIYGYYLHVESMFKKTINGLIEKDISLLNEVINVDEKQANEKELIIDELCIDILALYAPRGKTLRTTLMILKINNDLERIADHCVNISESAMRLLKTPQSTGLKSTMTQMIEYTSIMLNDAFFSFAKEDFAMAKDVLKRDDVVDELHHQNVRDLISEVEKETMRAENYVDFLLISTNLERIADLATNIAEDVIFIVEGKTYKHGRYE
jgi:phosphate transport system protein